VRRLKSIFRWGEHREIVPVGKWGSLQSLPGLKVGRTTAPEQNEIQPVSDEHFEATIPRLTPTLVRMVRFHRLTACRPQDVCALEWEAIDRSGAVWLFMPTQHKAKHHGHVRIVRIGPAAQALLGTPGSGFIFSPKAAFEEVLAARRAARKTPFYPSHAKHIEAKRKLAPRRRPKDRFTTQSYSRCIEKACEKAKVPYWTPNQIRHSALTDIRDKFGLDVAQVIAGHRHAKTTEIYAAASDDAARKAIQAIG
jgi:integrase